MKKLTQVRSALFVSVVLIVALFLSACATPEPRIPVTHTYNPGAAFSTNINDEDPRKVINCAVIFEVLDEEAITELAGYNAAIRNAVLMVLGELTMDELTVNKDLSEISQRLVDRVNEALHSNIPLIVGAYFIEFRLS